MALPFVDLAAQYERIKPLIDQRIRRVLEHGQFVLGPEVTELEERLAERLGCRHAITLASGTDALLAPMMARGIGPGDAVFLPSFTFVASAEVPLLLGARPVFVDVERESFNIDPEHLLQQIARTQKEGELRPRAIVGVDLFGRPADWQALEAIAADFGLFLIDDAAQSLGAEVDGRTIGTFADATSTSFYPAKPLGGYGEGGALFTDDDELAALVRSIRVHGAGDGAYDIVRVGINGRLDTLQAAILLAKLEIFDQELEARDRLAEVYSKELAGCFEVPQPPLGVRCAWAQYTIRAEQRDEVRKRLAAAGVPTAVYYPMPMHLQPAYRQFVSSAESFPVSERLSEEVLSLPMHAYLSDHDRDRVCALAVEASGRGGGGLHGRPVDSLEAAG